MMYSTCMDTVQQYMRTQTRKMWRHLAKIEHRSIADELDFVAHHRLIELGYHPATLKPLPKGKACPD